MSDFVNRLRHPGWLALIFPIVLAIGATFPVGKFRLVLLVSAVVLATWFFSRTEYGREKSTRTGIAAAIFVLAAVGLFFLGRRVDSPIKSAVVQTYTVPPPKPAISPNQGPKQNTKSLVQPLAAKLSKPPLRKREHPPAEQDTSKNTPTPQIGSVTQGPGSAFSYNQQGGITAGTVIVGSAPDLTMSNEQRQKASNLLGVTALNGINVEVIVTNQANETTFEFARQVEQLLQDSGAHVTEERVMYYVDGGIIGKGLTFSMPTKYNAVANTVVEALGQSGVIKCPRVRGNQRDDLDLIRVIVTPGSEPCASPASP